MSIRVPSSKTVHISKTISETLHETIFKTTLRALLRCAAVAILSVAGLAQSLVLDIPDQSQGAQVTQRIGITDVTIRYHRPLVKDRKVWGGLVPYGQVWRAGEHQHDDCVQRSGHG